jgi:ribosomal protein S18 acetylase RimI-like enzyme
LAYEIRRGRAGDFDQVLGLLSQLWPEADLDAESLQQVFLKYLEAESDDCICAVDDGVVTGFCSMNIKNCLLHAGTLAYVDVLIVKEGYRGSGVGAGLLEQTSNIAGERGCAAVWLDSGFQRTGAHDFYNTQGFKRLGFLFGKTI